MVFRMPCFFNGIFGHKPSTGIVPNAGQLPPAHGNHNVYLVTGPMCRSAGDLVPMYKVTRRHEYVTWVSSGSPWRVAILIHF
jgi:Asp-tRNA(Asn)/Glu-tRNA(Gln) amidotransferase A subunit family amidase